MDIVRLSIPYRFVRERTTLSWRELRWGLFNELLDPQAPVDLAVDLMGDEPEPSATLVRLASAPKDEPTFDLVEKLADEEALRSEDELLDKWLYLVLAWYYEHRNEVPDPLGRVEEVYADFGYPKQIEPFVGYMPMTGPDLGSVEANEGRMYERWKQYLDLMAGRF